MPNEGKLYVFEGPDGVGKSELAKQFCEHLRSRGEAVELMSFPGSRPGTLGHHIYAIHHVPASFGIEGITSTSLQALHIAAHVDAIETRILPLLSGGKTVVLDRFWWSTWVYGTAAGANAKALDAMIAAEVAVWGRVRPEAAFLIRRSLPLRAESLILWQKWSRLYEDVASEERRKYMVRTVDNEGEIATALAELISASEVLDAQMGQQSLLFDLPEKTPSRAVTATQVHPAAKLEPAKPTVVYDTYWKFAAERQEIFFRRFAASDPPWTNDLILAEYKFTNAYRASDRVSQYLIQDVIYRGDQSPQELFFRIILFKLFNKIETWELLLKTFGHISYADFNLAQYDRVLTTAIDGGQTIYSAAYIMPSGSREVGSTKKHRTHLRLLERMMEDEVASRLRDARSMQDAFTILRSYPMMGDFLAYQYVTDLNYSTLLHFSEMDFVVPGPGAKGGISKCFSSLGGLSEIDVIKLVADRQSEEFDRLGLKFRSLWGRPLQLIDCQNLFCEVDKYARLAHPEITGASDRTRIKQKFRCLSRTRLQYWYPPKWGLNGRIESHTDTSPHT